MDTLRFGFIGAGQIAHNSAKQVQKHPQGKVVAAHDPHPVRLSELADQFGIPNRHATSEALFADPEVDAVYIAVPNKFHAPLAIQALEAGKHVILEKPFAMNRAEALQVVETARRTGKVLTLGMNQRFVESHQKARALTMAGVFGEIYHAKAWWFRRSGIPKLGTWFGKKEFAGGGALNDIGVHLLDLCLYTIDNFDPISVSGSIYTKFGNRGLGEGKWGFSERSHTEFDVDDFATAMIKFANGTSVSLDVSWACHAAENSRMDVQIYGTEAGASVANCHLFHHDPLRAEYDVIEQVKSTAQYPHLCRFSNFINHLLNGEELCVTPEQALVVQTILDAIGESSRTGKEIIIPSASSRIKTSKSQKKEDHELVRA